jgi:hypothetical protein
MNYYILEVFAGLLIALIIIDIIYNICIKYNMNYKKGDTNDESY